MHLDDHVIGCTALDVTVGWFAAFMLTLEANIHFVYLNTDSFLCIAFQ